MRESRTYGSVRGARGNSRPYREGPFLLHLLTAGFGPSRHFATMQQFDRFLSEADINKSGHINSGASRHRVYEYTP